MLSPRAKAEPALVVRAAPPTPVARNVLTYGAVATKEGSGVKHGGSDVLVVARATLQTRVARKVVTHGAGARG